MNDMAQHSVGVSPVVAGDRLCVAGTTCGVGESVRCLMRGPWMDEVGSEEGNADKMCDSIMICSVSCRPS